MPFRFNYTGRQTILRRHVDVRLVGGVSEDPELLVGAMLEGYNFPPESRLRVEANTDSSTWIAYENAVSELTGGLHATQPYLTWVSPDDIKTVQFRFKVVDPFELRLLGATRDRFRLRDEITAIGTVLPAVPGETGELPYLMKFDDGPLFVLSKNLWPFRRRLMSLPSFRCVALPDVLRQILERGVIAAEPDLDQGNGDDGSESSWFSDWLDWMRSHPALAGHVEELDDIVDEELKSRWVSKVVGDFADHRGNRFSTRLKTWIEETGS